MRAERTLALILGEHDGSAFAGRVRSRGRPPRPHDVPAASRAEQAATTRFWERSRNRMPRAPPTCRPRDASRDHAARPPDGAPVP
ncbi:hypothetical protein SAMN02745673_00451 [Marinactinospora thermotolerans DSM 45154]|uniref:Uncharacterized protein n=1 Tax=Marinactinospora thermotolerans DSM 45154 TaxID=1122192 RepID=A0A1T4KM18_9ACTN|nr:hypothetical protein SAMN02745673_00451 [Marinactinospora thermotolerans DSM 45154]